MNNQPLSLAKAQATLRQSASVCKRLSVALMLSSTLLLSACGGGGGAGSSGSASSVAASLNPNPGVSSTSKAVTSETNSSFQVSSVSATSALSATSTSTDTTNSSTSKAPSSTSVSAGSTISASSKSVASNASSLSSVKASSTSAASVVTATSASSKAESSVAATVASIEIAPGSVSPKVSESQQLVAVGKTSSGSLVNLYGKVTWRISSGSGVASVTSTGLLKRLTAGNAEVEASALGKTATLKLTSDVQNLVLGYDNSTSKWTKVCAHLWTGESTAITTWPGVAMTNASNIWTHSVPAAQLSNGKVNVVFNDCVSASGKKTSDLKDVAASGTYDGTKWTTNSGGSTSAQVAIIGGKLAETGTLFTSGSVLTINADSADAFSQWAGASAAYIFTDPTKAQAKLVVPSGVTSLVVQSMHAEPVDPYKSARSTYAAQCVSCHGVNGSGGLGGKLDNITADYTVTSLASYISRTMPKTSVGTCIGSTAGTCAFDIASMIMANKWASEEVNTAAEGLDARNLRLLTKEEYLNSINDIFKEANVTFDASALSTVSAEASIRNFNTASFLSLDFDRALGYQMAATEIAKKIVASKAFLSLANNCGTATKCVTDIGKKVFRRPLTTAEVARYADLYSSADAGKAVLQGLLISPNFLYRSEMGVLDANSGLYRLTNYEIATLLSYSFWASTPDDALLAEAAKTTFDINAQVTRMLADTKAERGLRRFAQGWFINNKYGYGAISSPTLAEAFTEETIRFVVETIKADLPFKTILTANYTYANTELAQYYKSSPVAAGVWAKSTFSDTDPRSGTGVLGHGSFLASRIIGNTNPSPIKRGTFVRDLLMCQELPPPQAAGLAIGSNPDDSNREANARHTNDPGCQGCHQYIDGIGFGLESYGSNALFRTTETLLSGTVRQINALGEIKSLNSAETTLDPNSTPEQYQTVPQLATLIANSGQGAACYSRQFYRYVTGRNEGAADEKVIPVYSANVREGGGMKKMLIDLTLNPNFILRRK